MDETTQQNAALVEEAAAASQAIVEQAMTLNTLISRYNVGVVETRARASAPAERRTKERPWGNRAAPANAAAVPARRAAAGGADGEWSEF